MSHQTVIVLDFGGQYNQLIARRVRECGVYCEVKPYTTPLAELKAMNPIGIIFTGGPNSVYLDTSPQVDPEIFTWGVPILGICYGCQLMAHNLGGLVTPAQEDTAREYGKTVTYYDTSCRLFQDLPEQGISWMSHGDYMAKVPEGFALTAAAGVGARVLSSLLNFFLNKKLVFRSSADTGKTMLRYYCLAVPQMLLQILLTDGAYVLFHVKPTGVLHTLIYVVVMILLYIIGYMIQQRWVFAPQKQNESEVEKK